MKKWSQIATMAAGAAALILTASTVSAHKRDRVVVDAPYTSVEVDERVDVKAPHARVGVGENVKVDAPYTSVRVNKRKRRIRIRAPYVNLNIGY